MSAPKRLRKPAVSQPEAAEAPSIPVFRNAQRSRRLQIPVLQDFVQGVLNQQSVTAELGFHLVGTAEMARVNFQFLGHEGSTDIITFDHGSTADHLHGECFISVADAEKQAAEFGRPWTEELARYLIHGILHLQGYDDLEPDVRKVMKREENRLVRWAAASFDLREFERRSRPGRTTGR
jgi:rRNA maturation RNase YbeY